MGNLKLGRRPGSLRHEDAGHQCLQVTFNSVPFLLSSTQVRREASGRQSRRQPRRQPRRPPAPTGLNLQHKLQPRATVPPTKSSVQVPNCVLHSGVLMPVFVGRLV